MTRLIAEKVFNPKQPLLVRRTFSAAGRTFQPGDLFRWDRLAVSLRRTKLMFDAGMLMHSDQEIEADAEQTEPQTTEVQQTEEVTPPPADNSDLDTDSLMVLQAIARREGAALKSTKATQRQAIIDKRQG